MTTSIEKQTYSVRLNPDLKLAVERQALNEHSNFSNICAKALDKYLKDVKS